MTEAKKVKPDLPKGWAWTKIEEIAKLNFRDPGISSLPDDFIVTFLPMAAVDAEKGIIAKPEKRPLAQVRKGFTSFSEKDVLFAKITPSMENGKAAIACDLINGTGFGSTEFHVISPNAGILSEWLFYFIRQEKFRRNAKANFAGTAGQLRVPADFIKNYPIPLAPLPEQRRIVVRIEELFSRLNAGVEALQRAKIQLRRYRQAVLKAAVEGRLTEEWRKVHPEVEPAKELLVKIANERGIKAERDQNESYSPNSIDLPQLPKGWTWSTLSRIGELNRGISKHRPRDDPRLYGGPYPFIQTGDVRQVSGILGSYTQTYSEDGLKQSRLWPKGTLLITIAANIADTAILGFDACFPDSIVGFLTDPKKCNIQFVELFIRTAKESIERYAPATAQKNINLRILSDVAIPFPPLEEQDAIVNEAEYILSIADEADKVIEKSLKRADRLRQSILKRAFEGKLVHQDLSDEPANLLLIRTFEEKAQIKEKLKPFKRANRGEATMHRIRSSLNEVLAEAKAQLMPQELFYKAGFGEETIDEFYQELREEINKLRIMEIRPNEVDVYLKVVENENK